MEEPMNVYILKNKIDKKLDKVTGCLGKVPYSISSNYPSLTNATNLHNRAELMVARTTGFSNLLTKMYPKIVKNSPKSNFLRRKRS